MKYVVEAHYTDGRAFKRSFEALSHNHAGALFISEMKERACMVVIARLTGDYINLSGYWRTANGETPQNVIIDRIRRETKS